MKVYKTSIFAVGRQFYWSLGMGVAICAGLSWVSQNMFTVPWAIIILLSLVGMVFIFRYLLKKNNMKCELHEDGTFNYLENNELKATYFLPDFYISAYSRIESGIFGNHDIKLKLLRKAAEDIIVLHVGALRESQFDKMFEAMEKHSTILDWDNADTSYREEFKIQN